MNKIIQKYKTLCTYSFEDLGVFLIAWLTYIKWDIRLSVVHYSQWKKHISLSQEQHPLQHSNYATIQKIIYINEAAARNHLRKMNCLRRCLCQQEMLKNRNVIAKLHIGVKFENATLAAHSWLTVNSKLINDSEDIVATYTELTQKLDAKTLAAFS